jgi:GntR family transcriptional repressor for pyruvate dehydrogenase complex
VQNGADARAEIFAPLEVEGAVERIVRRLGEAIGSGVLEPGERLPPEVELADRLAVAPMTLRQALAVLRDAGYVETRRGRGGGTFVTDDLLGPLERSGRVPSRAELRDLIDWRRAVEGEAAALTAERADRAARSRIADAAAVAEAAAEGEFSRYRRSDSAYHCAIADLSGSARLATEVRSNQVAMSEILAALPGRTSTIATAASTRGHRPITAAIEAGRPDLARQAMLEHIEAVFDWIVGLHLGRLSSMDSK